MSIRSSVRSKARLQSVSSFRTSRRPLASAALALAMLAAYPALADASVYVMRPAREARSDQPLAVTIAWSGDAPTGSSIDIPRTVTITLTNGEALPRPVVLTRAAGTPEHLRLAAGEMKAVTYSGAWPDWARGALRIDVPGVDVSPATVLLTRVPETSPAAGTATASATPLAPTPQPALAGQSGMTPAAANATLAAVAPATVSPPPSNSLVPDLGTYILGRVSAYEPTYFADGTSSGGRNLARFQVSFKYRFRLPDDPRSRGVLDNLYFAYTQTSLWDIRSYSNAFRDTSFKPAFFYYVADTGWRTNWFTRMGVETGYEHESNGTGGAGSRGVDILYAKPIWDFGNLDDYHLTVAPKVYWYEHKQDNNGNIADYRGYVDLLLKYGSPDGWQLAATLRKGTKSTYGSIDTQLTYPLARIFSRGAGYLWIGYFNGYGEDILDYNQHRWAARIGFSVSR